MYSSAERVFGIRPKWHLLLRNELGATLVARFSQLPVVERFFAGGDNSVRGFAYNDLSPVETLCTKDAHTGADLLNPNGNDAGWRTRIAPGVPRECGPIQPVPARERLTLAERDRRQRCKLREVPPRLAFRT